ncbi:ABC transporter ATP-binding protein/permease [Apilactobacillus apisilvae]|uniref:ABC transporter ATP-binding protein/permease n=1 Tax=Apilactobacillus apisilvae TaxID=2923364 RepID=A0ABY4PG14_9LACO|nr:ABC transporter ATP-binding protein [Apilactobacillus apisilvae]UQS84459.1 ABC transporter ATP-binding protein/permease [Apilactobacillus apisilvae]
MIFISKLINYVKIFWQSFKLFWQAAKVTSSILLILIPIQALIPSILIKISQVMMDGLLHHNFSNELIVFWGIAFFVSVATIPINTSLQGILTDKLIAFVNIKLMKKSADIKGLNLFENADFYDNLQLVSSEASWRPVNLIVFGISMVREIITILSMMILLSNYSIFIAFILLLSIIPQSIISYHIQQNSFETMVTRSPDARKIQYYSETLLTQKDAKEVRLFGLFNFFIDSYHNVYQKMHSKMKKVRLTQMWNSLIFLLISAFLSVFSLVWIIQKIRNNEISAGSFLVFVSTLTATTASVYALIENSSLLYDTLLYMKKYFNFMNIKEQNDYSGTLAFPNDFKSIDYNHLSFSYPGQNELALNDVSFNVKSGERIAIVGENGSGKSTLVKLLMRFYDPVKGNIKINNKDINKMNIDDYRKNLSAVFQDYSKFYLPIKDSVGLGNIRKLNDKQSIINAMQDGNFYETFKNKNLSLNTMLGKQFDNGIDLSGGQWQKLAISRAFMADSKIIILDEPTASLDPRSEFNIYQSFIKMTENKTVFFITHRMSAVKLADEVLVLKSGKIVGFDSHDKLMKNNKYYADLYNLQAKSFE